MNQRIKIIVTFLFNIFAIFTHSGSTAGNENDSLLKIVRHTKDEPGRIKAYSRLTYLMMWHNRDSAKKMLDSCVRWINRKGGREEKCRLLNLKGTYHWFNGNLDSAMFYLRKYHEYSVKYELPEHYRIAVSNMGALFNAMGTLDSARIFLNESLLLNLRTSDSTSIAKNYFDLGNLYNKLNYNDLSLEHLQWAAAYYERKKDSVRACMVFNSLGTTYQKIGNFQKSHAFTMKALQYDLVLDGVDRVTDLYNNLGVTYWQVKKDYDSARYYMLKSNEYSSANSRNVIARYTFLTNLGGLEADVKNYPLAFKYLSEAYHMELPFQDDYKKSALLVNLGFVFYKIGHPDSARTYLNEGLKLAQRISANDHIKNAYTNLHIVDSAAGNWKSAMAYYKLSRDYADTLANENVRNKIAELEIIYETHKKQKENDLLKTQNSLNEKVIFNQRLILIISLSSLTIIFIFLIFILLKHRQLKFAHEQLRIKGEELRKKQEEIEIKNKSLEIQKEELTELNQTKDKIFSIIAHDLRSPFNALLGFLDMLENEFDEMNDEEKLAIIKKLHLGSENTYNLLINLLDWSRSQRGLIQNNPEYFDLQQITDLAIEVLVNRAAKKEHRIENLIEPHVKIFADPNLLEQILINLINNAIKFTPRQGRIIISAVKSEQFVSISVKDTGIGIPESKIEEIFSLSSGFNRKGTENEIGTGLGLNLCREYMDLMGGSIAVESVVDGGATFTINIPLVKPAKVNG